MIWLAGAGSLLLLVLVVVGLVDLGRNRDKIETPQVVIWAIVIVLVPVIGLVSYLLWRIARSDAMVESMDFQDEHSSKGQSYPPVGR
ncbi:MAG: PLD nuclease N-terminal domain-containing protein [Actinomycetia bacterium]|nr:PLD nuclease N-terminal domain-containing protein [Actinomycetes bacterium]